MSSVYSVLGGTVVFFTLSFSVFVFLNILTFPNFYFKKKHIFSLLKLKLITFVSPINLQKQFDAFSCVEISINNKYTVSIYIKKNVTPAFIAD